VDIIEIGGQLGAADFRRIDGAEEASAASFAGTERLLPDPTSCFIATRPCAISVYLSSISATTLLILRGSSTICSAVF
jgi:hypothetical protein